MLRLTVILISISLLILSCTSRLRTEVYKYVENQKYKLANGDNYYVNGYQLSFDSPLRPISRGSRALVIINQTTAGQTQIIKTGMIQSDLYAEYRILFELPQASTVDSVSLINKSICNIIGEYEIDTELRQYYCREGYFKIDSVKMSRLFGTFKSLYINSENDSLKFGGSLNITKKAKPLN
ncbi:MAG: hypothetical protein ABIJ45_02675 [Candidatus Zixiibacteriota bacterium]